MFGMAPPPIASADEKAKKERIVHMTILKFGVYCAVLRAAPYVLRAAGITEA